MSVIKSNEIFSPQNYCDTFFGVCPVFSGNQDELRSLLDENGYSNLRDFPFDAIESIVKNKIPVVLVDTTYINNDCEMVSEHRWFEVPDENPHFEIGDVLENTIIGIEDWDGEKSIHYYAYSYCSDNGAPDSYRFVEYTFFIETLAKALQYGIKQYESDYQEEVKQYIEDCKEDELIRFYEHYDNGEAPAPILVSEITMGTPYGMYILED